MTHNPEVNSPAAKEARQVVASSGRSPSSGMQDWRMPLQDTLVIPPVVLIGPVSVGKSTVAGLLADRMGWPHVSMDAVCAGYYT
jgi:2-phosphoglycerate kinase